MYLLVLDAVERMVLYARGSLISRRLIGKVSVIFCRMRVSPAVLSLSMCGVPLS